MTLLADLARLLRRLDPMPPRVIEDALAAGALVHPRAELVVLAETVAAVRSTGRRLRLGRAGEPLVEVEIRQVGGVQRLAGLAPAAPLAIRHESGDVEVHVGAGGYFTVEVPAGPIRIALDDAESGWL
jgi:hypothetical protein